MIMELIKLTREIETKLGVKGDTPPAVVLALLFLEEQEDQWTREKSEQFLAQTLTERKTGDKVADQDLIDEMVALAEQYKDILG